MATLHAVAGAGSGDALLLHTTISATAGAQSFEPPASSRVADLAAGAEVDGHRIERVLGRGGMAVVYEATQLSLQRRIALKLLSDCRASDGELRARFRREALLQASLCHPNVVEVFEAGFADAGAYITMRLIRGETLKVALRAGTLSPEAMLDLLAPIADALDHAHAAGLVHRDVKPQNILIGPRGEPYLADFGILRTVGDTALTGRGVAIGTPDYMAPEQRAGDAATSASDVYALAAVMYECLTGQLAIHRSRSEGGRLAGVIERGLCERPSERPASAGDLVLQARAACARRRPPSRRAAPLGARPRHPRPSPWRGVAGCAFVGCYAATAVAALWNMGGTDPPRAPARVAVEMERPLLTDMTRQDFLREHRMHSRAADAGAVGVGIDANVVVRGSAGRLSVSCTLRDLSAKRQIPGAGMLAPGLDSAMSSTAACWLPVSSRAGHRYRATIRVWRAGGAGAPLATRTRTFVARTDAERTGARPDRPLRPYGDFSPPTRFVPADDGAV